MPPPAPPITVSFSVESGTLGFSLEDNISVDFSASNELSRSYEVLPESVVGNAFLGGNLVSENRHVDLLWF